MHFSCCVEQRYSKQGKPVGKVAKDKRWENSFNTLSQSSQYLGVSVISLIGAKPLTFVCKGTASSQCEQLRIQTWTLPTGNCYSEVRFFELDVV